MSFYNHSQLLVYLIFLTSDIFFMMCDSQLIDLFLKNKTSIKSNHSILFLNEYNDFKLKNIFVRKVLFIRKLMGVFNFYSIIYSLLQIEKYFY